MQPAGQLEMPVPDGPHSLKHLDDFFPLQHGSR
jgi:hypothetical protein